MMEKTSSDIRPLWQHAFWADRELLQSVASCDGAPDAAVREFAHVIGTHEVWLSRLEGRPASLPVWPSVSASDLDGIVRQTHERWEAYLSGLREPDFQKLVTYTNSAGRHFENTIGDILLHVVLHGQYHRGKVNLMLRQAELVPSPVDYIAFVRGAPAATEADSRATEAGSRRS